MSGQPCYLRIGDDSVDDAAFHRSIQDAVAEYEACARELDGYGQRIDASIHFVDAKGDEPDEYPDRVLSLGPRGGIKIEGTGS